MQLEEAKSKYLTGEFKLKSEFQASHYAREETLTRAERYAGFTLPSIFPEDPLMEYDEMQLDFQSIGAQLTTNLANKMMMALFQPSKPFFRLKLTPEQRASIEEDSELTPAEAQEELAAVERDAMVELSKVSGRVVLNDAMLHLIITGNAVVYNPKDDDMQLYSLRDYIIHRDLRGKMVKLILRETKAAVSLEPELQALAYAEGYKENDELTVYTGICRVGADRFIIWQELEDICYCHKKLGYVKEDHLDYIPLTWKLLRGKDYGTGLVEDYSGDFHQLSTLAEALLDYTAIATDVKNLVNPTGMTDAGEITKTASGGYVHGREADLFPYTAADKLGNSATFLQERSDKIERRLAAAFLKNTSVTRDAERVTAVEIRMNAQELESSLGGIYSRLAKELQLPLAVRLIRRMDPDLKDIEPVIVTGFDSLSRNSDLDNLRAFVADIAILAELPDLAMARLNVGDYIAMLAAGHGVDASQILKSEEDVKLEEERQIKLNAANAGGEAQAVAQAQGPIPQ